MNKYSLSPQFRIGIIFAFLTLLLAQTFDLPSEARYGVRRAAAHRRAAHKAARRARQHTRHERKVAHRLARKIAQQHKHLRNFG